MTVKSRESGGGEVVDMTKGRRKREEERQGGRGGMS